jgi:hypothetical protein
LGKNWARRSAPVVRRPARGRDAPIIADRRGEDEGRNAVGSQTDQIAAAGAGFPGPAADADALPGVVRRRHLRKVPIGETAVRLERFRDPSLQHRRLGGTSPLLTAERLR